MKSKACVSHCRYMEDTTLAVCKDVCIFFKELTLTSGCFDHHFHDRQLDAQKTTTKRVAFFIFFGSLCWVILGKKCQNLCPQKQRVGGKHFSKSEGGRTAAWGKKWRGDEGIEDQGGEKECCAG